MTCSENVGSSSVACALRTQAYARETPTWIPHASANRARSEPGADRSTAGVASAPSNKERGGGAERIQTISDSQRKFAAQFSRPMREGGGAGLPADARGSGGSGSRWASKAEKPQERIRAPRPPENPGIRATSFHAAGAHYRAHVHGKETEHGEAPELTGRLAQSSEMDKEEQGEGGVQVGVQVGGGGSGHAGEKYDENESYGAKASSGNKKEAGHRLNI